MYDTIDKRWRAVQTRDRAADTAFVYAVITTRIYCRPTCPGRLARRANVQFFDTTTDAAAASFRPCKRCKPDQVRVHRASELVESAKEYIRLQQGEVTLDQLADHLEISARYLHHIFSKAVGCTPAAYALPFRKSVPYSTRSSSNATPMSGVLTPSLIGNTTIWGDLCTDDFGLLPTASIENVSMPHVDENLDMFTPSLTPEQVQMLWDDCSMVTDPLICDSSWNITASDDASFFNATPLDIGTMFPSDTV